MIIKSLEIENIDITLLEKQRDYLLSLPLNDNIEGIINLLDYILDKSIVHYF
jgi:hypothetical protein